MEPQVQQACALIRNAGVDCPNILEGVQNLIVLAAAAITRPADGDETVCYFIPYEMKYTKYANSPPESASLAHGMTVISVPGGIRNFQDVLAVAREIEAANLAQYPNPSVCLQGFFELDRWKSSAAQARPAAGLEGN